MNQTIKVSGIKVKQPIGTFYIASIKADELKKIAYADMCKLSGKKESDLDGMEGVSVDEYTGWQRKLNKDRVKEIKQFVQQPDACFPTGIILAVDSSCAKWDDKTSTLEMFPSTDGKIPLGHIARILDGQHRLAGLDGFSGDFDLNVSVFVGLDVAEQAYIFSMVNLAQTKVNKSLVYELYDSAKRRSPQKLCHQIAVALDSVDTSPFYRRIKRLGCSTPDREGETITQATFVKSLMAFLTDNENEDRRRYAEDEPLDPAGSAKTVFRQFMVDKKDMELTKIIYNYFLAVKQRWPKSWESNARGQMLNKANGFMALMRFLGAVYPKMERPRSGVPSQESFYRILEYCQIADGAFTTEVYVPGSAGESALFRDLCSYCELLN